MKRLLLLLLFPLLAFGQTVQINQGAQTSKGIAPLTTGLTSINGDTTPAQTIQGAGGITVSTAQGTGVTTINGAGGPLFRTSYSAMQSGWPGGQIVAVSNPAGAIRANHFYYGGPYPAIFDAIYLAGQGIDGTNGTAMAIWDETVASNHMLCHSLSKTFPTATAYRFDCVEGSVQLTPGHDYVFMSASGGTALTVYSTNLALVPLMTKFSNSNVATGAGYSCTFDSTAGGNGIGCSGNFPLAAQYVTSATSPVSSAPMFYLVSTIVPTAGTVRNVAPTGTSFTSAMAGFPSGAVINPVSFGNASRIVAYHFHYGAATDTTFGNIYMSIAVGDSGSLSTVAIWDASTTPGSMLCHSHPMATLSSTAAQFPCIEGSVSLIAGHDYIFMRSSTSVTTTAYGTSDQFVISRFSNYDVTRPVASGGLACTLSAASTAGAGIGCPPGTVFTLGNYGLQLGILPITFYLQ